MKYIITGFLLFCASIVSAQMADQNQFSSSITAGDLKKHLFAIAAPEMEGRETATEGQRKAAAYIENFFKSTGLSGALNGSFQQQFTVYRDSIVKAELTVSDQALKNDSDFAVSSNSGFNVILNAGEILFAGFGLSDSVNNDYKNINARGKIVLVMPGAVNINDKRSNKKNALVPDMYTLQQAAGKNGAAALLIVDSRFPRAGHHGKSNMYIKEYRKAEIPNTFFISDSVAKLIMGNDYATVKKKSRSTRPSAKTYQVPIVFELQKYTEHLQSSNVLGMIEGTDKKDEAIIITAHYDHMGKSDTVIYYGADDDGSGTSAVLELAEAFSTATAAGNRPRRSIIFMTVSGEEKGLWGSAYYSENPAFPMEKTSANLNIDMIGRVESERKDDSLNYIYVVGDNRLSSDLRPISESANKKAHNFVLDYKFNDPNDPQRIYYRSDHYNFAKNGVPAIFYFNGLHEDYHRPTDTPDKINYELLAKRTQLIFLTAWEMANRDNMLKRDLE